MLSAQRLVHEPIKVASAELAYYDLPLFRYLPLDVLLRLQHLASQRTFRAGDTIRCFEHPLECTYIVLRGAIKIRTWHDSRSEAVMMIAGKGDVLGGVLNDSKLRPIERAEAATETTLLWLSNHDFDAFLRSSPVLNQNMMQLLMRRLRTMECHLQAQLRFDVAGCLAYQINNLVQLYGERSPEGEVSIPFPLNQSDLASLIGASRVRVNNVVMDFKRRGIISLNSDHCLVIHQPKVLEKMCQ